MAKNCYIGIDGIAKEVKKWYIGVDAFYTPLDYIESTGTQYIDTEVMPNTNTKIELDMEITSAEKNAFLFGSRVASGNTQFDMLMDVSSDSHWRFDTGSVITKISNSVFIGRHQFAMTVNSCTIDGTVTVNSVTTLSSNLPIYLLTINNNGQADSSSSNTKLIGKLYSCKIYENDILIRDFIPCLDSNGIACLYDNQTRSFFYNLGSDSFIAGSTSGDVVAAKSVARKIKKAYIGIGGIARPCWGAGELVYYGTTTSLGYEVTELAATTIGNYALFGGGVTGSSSTGTERANVYYYTKSLSRGTATALSYARYGLAATTVGSYAIFGGGAVGERTNSYVDAYNSSLTKNTSISGLSSSVKNLSAATTGNYALFAGGRYSSTSYNAVTAYDISLTKSSATSLSSARYWMGAASVGNYALFAGGYGPTSVVDAYDISLTRTTPTALSEGKFSLGATSVGDYALFGGGKQTSGYFSSVDAYDTSLTKTVATPLSVARSSMLATTVENYGVFAGGSNAYNSKVVDVYDTSLTKTVAADISENHNGGAATTVDKYALFAGGGSVGTKIVEAYTVV